jgi:peroxiredoxin
MLAISVMLPWLLIGFGCWLGYELVRQNGRILLRLEALEKSLEQISAQGLKQTPSHKSGLQVGSIAPAFELPDLFGGRRALSGFAHRRLLLIFFNPSCGFCTNMVSDLAKLPFDGSNGHAVPLIVTTGDAETNRKLFEKHKFRCPVLLQRSMEVASQYEAYGTPTGYLIDENGAIASELAVGAPALLALAPGRRAAPDERQEQQKPTAKGNKSLADSRLNRSGLEAGTPAPSFRLPRLDGLELTLEEYRGRRVLLIFSDPQCGPCDELAPRLEQLHRDRRDLQVLMVSRRDSETNRQKAKKLGITFPVVLQNNWEVSLLYAMFATPMGYLIDERGTIAADVAVGVQPILDLASVAPILGNGHVKDLLLRPDSSPTSKEQKLGLNPRSLRKT